MSKKIVLLSAVIICAFLYGCGTQKNNDVQPVNTENSEINNDVDIAEIPVAERNDWESIVVQWWGRDGAVEINETFEEDIAD